MSHTSESDYPVLLGLVVRLIESQEGKKIVRGEEWQNDAQILAIKLFQHLVSMMRTATVTQIEVTGRPTISFIDHASAKVVTRAAFETYLVFFYLYGNLTHDPSLCEFRHKAWKLGGLTDRQKFFAKIAAHRAKLEDERKQINALVSELQASSHIASYSEKQRRSLLDGHWRTGRSWVDLGKGAGFYPRYFSDVYTHLCGYSHSSYISALQVRDASLAIQDQRMLSELCLHVGVVLMAHFAFTYADAFSSAAIVLDSDPDTKQLAEGWRFGAEDMAHVYGG